MKIVSEIFRKIPLIELNITSIIPFKLIYITSEERGILFSFILICTESKWDFENSQAT